MGDAFVHTQRRMFFAIFQNALFRPIEVKEIHPFLTWNQTVAGIRSEINLAFYTNIKQIVWP